MCLVTLSVPRRLCGQNVLDALCDRDVDLTIGLNSGLNALRRRRHQRVGEITGAVVEILRRTRSR